MYWVEVKVRGNKRTWTFCEWLQGLQDTQIDTGASGEAFCKGK